MLAKRPFRALKLLLLLSQHDGLSLSQIALHLDCSHRTAAEDLDLLRTSGFEVIWTADGYRIAGLRGTLRQRDREALRWIPSHAQPSLAGRAVSRRHPLRWSLSRPPSTI